MSGSKSASARAFENYTGTVIAYEDLKIKEKIGHGGFGDVHVAQWKAAAVGSKPEKWNGNFELCLLHSEPITYKGHNNLAYLVLTLIFAQILTSFDP